MRPCCLLLALLLSSPAVASPLSVERIIELSQAGLTEDAIARLVVAEGLAAPLDADDALRLRAAGVPASLVSRLIEWGADDGIDVEQRDGVVVVTGTGLPEDEEMGDWPPPADVAPDEGQDNTWVRLAEDSDPGGQSSADATGPGYPTGAVFGWSGGAVFLPARFGGSRPSAFGRTLVSFDAGLGCSPILQPMAWPTVAAPETRLIPVRTSRGEMWIPN